MSKVCAVLLDMTGIQGYVFGSNKLRENTGASLLVSQTYHSFLRQAIASVFPGKNFDFEAWQQEQEAAIVGNDAFEVGYIGGGNALLFFQNTDSARAFLREWSKILLIETPGLVPASAYLESESTEWNDPARFSGTCRNLFESLRENKGKCSSPAMIPQHGITAECSHTGLSMEVWNESEKQYMSSSSHAKIEGSRDSLQSWEDQFAGVLQNKYCFTNDLDQLGQIEGEDSHSAIVHIDGNDMAEMFRKNAKSLQELRKLSREVNRALQQSFEYVLQTIVDKFDKIQKALGFTGKQNSRYPHDRGLPILPIRPIVLEGDDNSFVCDGKLGIYFSSLFMKKWQEFGYTACAGIAITKSKFPFYRGYCLAEELCQNAKKIRKACRDDGRSASWLDFHIATGNFLGSLEEIRKSQYEVVLGNLIFRPYRLDQDNERGFDLFVQRTRQLQNKFPNNKLKELQRILTLGSNVFQVFQKEQAIQKRTLPEIPGKSYHEKLFQDSVSPYFDMLELMEFYPDFELEKSAQKGV